MATESKSKAKREALAPASGMTANMGRRTV